MLPFLWSLNAPTEKCFLLYLLRVIDRRHLHIPLYLNDLHLYICNDIVSTKIYDERDDFDFEIVNFPF